jgi:hypothetical protein
MLSCPVFAKLQPRPHPEVASSRLALSSIPVIQLLHFQSLADSSAQWTPRNPFLFNRFRTLSIAMGVYTPLSTLHSLCTRAQALHDFLPRASRSHLPRVTYPFRINTCKSVSKQTTLIPFRMNTYEKQGGRGVPPSDQILPSPSIADHRRFRPGGRRLLPPRLQLSTGAGQLFALFTMPMRHLPARPRPSTFVLCRGGSFLYPEFYCPYPPLPATLSFSQEVSL